MNSLKFSKMCWQVVVLAGWADRSKNCCIHWNVAFCLVLKTWKLNFMDSFAENPKPEIKHTPIKALEFYFKKSDSFHWIVFYFGCLQDVGFSANESSKVSKIRRKKNYRKENILRESGITKNLFAVCAFRPVNASIFGHKENMEKSCFSESPTKWIWF